MLGIFRKRSAAAAEVSAALLGHLDRQVDSIWQASGLPMSPVARSFFFHDYVTGLFAAAEQSRRLSRRRAKRAFIRYLEGKFGVPHAAARSCYRTSRGHCHDHPYEKAFRDGLADGNALLARQPADTPLIRQFEKSEKVMAMEPGWAPLLSSARD